MRAPLWEVVGIRVNVNLALMATVTTVFFFIAGLRPSLFAEMPLFAVQLVLAVPLLLCSTLLLNKAISAKSPKALTRTATTLFTAGYAFMVNSTGILLSILTTTSIAMLFFAGHMLVVLGYTWFVVVHENDSLARRLRKDAFFAALLFLLGVLPSLR